jgi:histidyl-tRNA synthetase
MDLNARNLKGQLKYAARLGTRYTVVIGDDEIDRGVVQLKDMDAHEQNEISIENIVEELKKKA